MRLFVIGCGTTGLRHLRNAPQLGLTDVWAFDPIPSRREAAAAAGAQVVDSLDAGLGARPTAVIVGTPAETHVEVATRALEAGAHLFIERPIGGTLDGVEALVDAAEARERIVFAGYNLRFHAGLREILGETHGGAVGRVRAVRAEYGGARPSPLGVLLDRTDAIDFARALVGDFDRGYACAQRDGQVDPRRPDLATVVLHTPAGVQVDLHLDALPRRPAQSCTVIGTRGTLTWDVHDGLTRFDATTGRTHRSALRADPNHMFLDELACFLDCVQGARRPPVDGRTAMRVLEIARSLVWAAGAKQEVEL